MRSNRGCFEAFAFAETVCLLDQPSDFVVESFQLGIADMSKRPETDNAVEFVPDCPSIRKCKIRKITANKYKELVKNDETS